MWTKYAFVRTEGKFGGVSAAICPIEIIKEKTAIVAVFFHGRGSEIRTHDLCVPNAALYQTEPYLDEWEGCRKATALFYMVEVARFELTTSASLTQRSTKLSHTSTFAIRLYRKCGRMSRDLA